MEEVRSSSLLGSTTIRTSWYFIHMNESTPRGTGERKSEDESQRNELENLAKKLTSQDYYERLGLSRGATDEEVRGALRRFAKYHPGDKNAGLQDVYTEVFKLYTEAQSTLKNPRERSKYDSRFTATAASSGRGSAKEGPPSTARNQQEGSFQKESAIRDIHQSLDLGIRAYVNRRDKWVREGVVTREEIDKSPAVRKRAYKELSDSTLFGFFSFIRTRDQWVAEGVITKKEINENKGVREFVYKDISASLALGLLAYTRTRDQWVKEGVITREEIDRNPGVRKQAYADISSSLQFGGVSMFVRTRDGWANEGVITKDEINSNPDVKRIVLQSLRDALRRSGPSFFSRVRDDWMRHDVITKAEADSIHKGT